MSFDKKTIAKKVVRFVVGSCVATTVSKALANNTNPENAFEKTETVIGALVVGGIAAEAAGKYTDSIVDQFVDAFQKDSTPQDS